MKRCALVFVLLLSSSSLAVDQKSLLLGVAIGLGVYTTQHGIVPAITALASKSKRATLAVGRGSKRMLLGKTPKDAKLSKCEQEWTRHCIVVRQGKAEYSTDWNECVGQTAAQACKIPTVAAQ